ncbi:MAG: glycosyl transferase family 1 [Bacteroidetes bacterium SW_9_63_38]|nr:MAG: glycosyl transferase family 1 [Bacteroidetes bacterium SW_9_63_38]
MARPSLLFSHMGFTSFVEDELALLRRHFDVRAFHFDAEKAASARGLIRLWIRQGEWLLEELPDADLVFGWFADHHVALPTLLARWFDVPVAVMLGGMDCNWLPEYDYGVWDSRWRAPLVRWIVRRADSLPTVSPTLIEAEEQFSNWPERRRNGIRIHVPDLQTPHPVVPLGFRPGDWPMGPVERASRVVTVAFLDSWRTYKVKGIDLFLAAARRMPDVDFRVVGVSGNFAAELRSKETIPNNVTLSPPRPRDHLSTVYQNASVYAQLSRVEAFGLVVGEAMLSGCIPVVSAVGQPPDLVGDTGGVVQRPDPERIAETIREELGGNGERRRASRARIVEQFSMDQRETRLVRLLNELRRRG